METSDKLFGGRVFDGQFLAVALVGAISAIVLCGVSFGWRLPGSRRVRSVVAALLWLGLVGVVRASGTAELAIPPDGSPLNFLITVVADPAGKATNGAGYNLASGTVVASWVPANGDWEYRSADVSDSGGAEPIHDVELYPALTHSDSWQVQVNWGVGQDADTIINDFGTPGHGEGTYDDCVGNSGLATGDEVVQVGDLNEPSGSLAPNGSLTLFANIDDDNQLFRGPNGDVLYPAVLSSPLTQWDASASTAANGSVPAVWVQVPFVFQLYGTYAYCAVRMYGCSESTVNQSGSSGTGSNHTTWHWSYKSLQGDGYSELWTIVQSADQLGAVYLDITRGSRGTLRLYVGQVNAVNTGGNSNSGSAAPVTCFAFDAAGDIGTYGGDIALSFAPVTSSGGSGGSGVLNAGGTSYQISGFYVNVSGGAAYDTYAGVNPLATGIGATTQPADDLASGLMGTGADDSSGALRQLRDSSSWALPTWLGTAMTFQPITDRQTASAAFDAFLAAFGLATPGDVTLAGTDVGLSGTWFSDTLFDAHDYAVAWSSGGLVTMVQFFTSAALVWSTMKYGWSRLLYAFSDDTGGDIPLTLPGED